MTEHHRPKRLAVCLAHGFGLGLIPKAPGTWGSLWGLLLVWGLQSIAPVWGCAAAVVPLFLLGVWVCAAGQRQFGRNDPPQVVFDELAAFPLVFVATPLNLWSAVLGFALFRLFDIVKPWPVRRFERYPGGWGVMADDAAAGVMAGTLLWAAATFVFR